MSAAQGDIMVGNVKSLVDRLSKDFSSARPPLSIHEPRKTMPKSSPIQHVITTFAYTAAQDDELTLELGDVIEVLEEVEDGWSRGRQLRTGLVGMFPTNFVKPDVAPSTTTNREEDKGVVIRHAGDLPDLPEANRRTPSVVGGNSFLNKALHAEAKEEPKTKGNSFLSNLYNQLQICDYRVMQIRTKIFCHHLYCVSPIALSFYFHKKVTLRKLNGFACLQFYQKV
ncbi:unnamed protein product [Cylicostephanus goldi]|uniref:SH3 domain-containing protein n=1 Tax=Cylicostephanus goldi TaxID=71465 RepID=A0A3P7Q772_CYLGO|nr:unnamed protein product [Cylicostephanus goldi]